MDAAVDSSLHAAKSRCYLLPWKPYRKGEATRFFETNLEEEEAVDGTPPWLTEDKFCEASIRVTKKLKKIFDKKIWILVENSENIHWTMTVLFNPDTFFLQQSQIYFL